MRAARALAALASAAAAVALITGPVDAASATTPPSVSVHSLLIQLQVAAPDRSHRYQRSAFNYDDDWVEAGNGRCYTRKEVLIHDATHIDHVSRSCAVYGTWTSLYDDVTTSSPSSLEIDHLVPLGEAWHAGAWAWSAKKKTAFGNDIDYRWDLQAVTASLNQAKGDGDPTTWLPPKNRCTYIAAWIGVKYRWHLSVDPAEKATLTRWVSRCGALKVLRPGVPDIDRLASGGPLHR